ncbi:B3 domain-containing protein At1g05920-like [Punica granatum]|uniref:B3 domain-containing protein At1g05920-like n=1 Tax=Punica granatum TaxID=22663 RepID=A0A6P8E0C0_PUNGR|nr:B3 domain-containing protein At1g05920-like [Punica granatum]
MAKFFDLSLLANVASIVADRPARMDFPLEVEIRVFNEGLGMIAKKRSVRAKKSFKKAVDVGASLMIAATPSRIFKKRHRKMGVKRATVGDGSASAPIVAIYPGLPMAVLSTIQSMGGSDVKLILEKKLTCSDMKADQGRFLLPRCQILANFLDQEEWQRLESGGNIWVPIIEPCLRVSTLSLKRWKMSSSHVFVLNTGWNKIAHNPEYGLAEDDVVQVWSYRVEGRLCFAIVKAIIGASEGSTEPSSPSSTVTHV